MADIDRYLSLITSEHSYKPNFKALVSAFLQHLDDAGSLADMLYSHFDLDTAVGTQLDAIGEIVGKKRTVDFQPTDSGDSPVLDDDMYRLVIRAKIAQNQWSGTILEIKDIWESLFPTVYLILKDNQDMTMDALIIGLSTQLERDLVTNGYIVPKPQSVGINYAYPPSKVFAYGLETDIFGGYEDGYWLQYF